TMRELTPATYDFLDELGEYTRSSLRKECANAPLTISGIRSFFKVTASEHEAHNYRDSAKANKAWEELASLALLTRGYFLSTALQGCTSTATTRQEIDALSNAVAMLIR